MMFKSSYVVTENNGLLRCEPAIGRRQMVALGLAAVASMIAGIAAYSVLSANVPAQNRVAWELSPKVVRTAHVTPRGPIVMTTARMVPSSTVQAADESKAQPRS